MANLLKKAKENRDSTLRQQAKIAWLMMGDENTRFFHQSINQRRISSTINVLHIEDEITTDQRTIQEVFYKFYTDLLCTNLKGRRNINMNVIHSGPILFEAQQTLFSLSQRMT